MFKKPFSFNGRIRRLEWGLSYLLYFVLLFAISAAEGLGSDIATVGLGLLIIPVLWFLLAQAAKRCHDVGNSGWFMLIPFYVLILLFQEGNPGRNEYGSNPKSPEQADVLEAETLDAHLKN